MREHQRSGRVSLSAFYARRAFRILPALWLVLGFAIVMTLAGVIAANTNSFLLASGFLCNVHFEQCGWFAGHVWSLGVEEQFYLVWPLLLIMLRFRVIAHAALASLMLFSLLVQLLGVD